MIGYLRQPVALGRTPASAIASVHRHLTPADVPSLLQRHFRIIDRWSPIARAALDWPLVLCDYRSLEGKIDFHVSL